MKPKLRLPEFTDEWQANKLGDLVVGVGGKPLEGYVNSLGKYKFISIGNYSADGKYIDNGQRIDANSETTQKILHKDDIAMLLNDKTAGGNIIGSAILIARDDTYIYNQRTERLIPRQNIYAKYLWIYLNSGNFRKKIFSLTQGGTQIYVNFSSVEKMAVVLPSKPEQQKIADLLSSIDEKITLSRDKLEKTKEFKKSLLQRMFV